MSKQDRQGVRRASDLEQKYDFGMLNDLNGMTQRQNEQLSIVNQMLSQFIVETNERFSKLQEQVVLAEITLADDVYSLVGEVTYATLMEDFKAKKEITLFRTLEDGSTRYYHCMGTNVTDGKLGLIFQYGYGTEIECIFIGEGTV